MSRVTQFLGGVIRHLRPGAARGAAERALTVPPAAQTMDRAALPQDVLRLVIAGRAEKGSFSDSFRDISPGGIRDVLRALAPEDSAAVALKRNALRPEGERQVLYERLRQASNRITVVSTSSGAPIVTAIRGPDQMTYFVFDCESTGKGVAALRGMVRQVVSHSASLLQRDLVMFRVEKPATSLISHTIGGAHVPSGSASGDFLVHPLRGCPDSVVATAPSSGKAGSRPSTAGPRSKVEDCAECDGASPSAPRCGWGVGPHVRAAVEESLDELQRAGFAYAVIVGGDGVVLGAVHEKAVTIHPDLSALPRPVANPSPPEPIVEPEEAPYQLHIRTFPAGGDTITMGQFSLSFVQTVSAEHAAVPLTLQLPQHEMHYLYPECVIRGLACMAPLRIALAYGMEVVHSFRPSRQSVYRISLARFDDKFSSNFPAIRERLSGAYRDRAFFRGLYGSPSEPCELPEEVIIVIDLRGYQKTVNQRALQTAAVQYIRDAKDLGMTNVTIVTAPKERFLASTHRKVKIV
ncbi:MAG: hypothetical protein HYV02_00220 [Deltaproteobacteria bacterium]|nr:hypothetical protein [Deltaproteobacteria bacterium]